MSETLSRTKRNYLYILVWHPVSWISSSSLFPALKIEANEKMIRILPALNTIEDQYKKMVSKGQDVEICHGTILGKYPSRLAINENFKELAATNFNPEFR